MRAGARTSSVHGKQEFLTPVVQFRREICKMKELVKSAFKSE